MHNSRNVSTNSTTIYQSRCFLLNASRHFLTGTVWSKDGANRVHVARKVVVSPVSKPNRRACENPFSSPPALKSLRDKRLRPPLPRPRWSPPEQAPLGPPDLTTNHYCLGNPIPRTNLASSQKSSSARRTRCPGLPQTWPVALVVSHVPSTSPVPLQTQPKPVMYRATTQIFAWVQKTASCRMHKHYRSRPEQSLHQRIPQSTNEQPK